MSQWAHTEVQESLFKNKKNVLNCKSNWTLKQITQRGCSVTILGDIQNLTQPWPALVDSALSSNFGLSSFQSCLPASAFLCFCELSLFECLASRLQSPSLRHLVCTSFRAVNIKVKVPSLINGKRLMSPVANFICLSMRVT